MAINETIVTGRKLRKLVDATNKIWQRISIWSKASDVEFNDAKTAETKVGAIDGITDSLVSTSSRIAASAKALSQLNNNLTARPEWIYGTDGRITGYRTKAGADTEFPFFKKPISLTVYSYYSTAGTFVAPEDGIYIFDIYTTSTTPYLSINGEAVDGKQAWQTGQYYTCICARYLEKGVKVVCSTGANGFTPFRFA